jgi:ketosteroid isomerase-like protein
MSDNATQQAITHLFNQIGQDASPETIATCFSETIDWYIAGDTSIVPWIGKKTGRKGVAEFYAQIRTLITSESFEVTDILTNGNHAVVTGHLASRVNSTGKLIETAFAFDILVEDGLITRYHMLEDSFAVAQALQP